MAVSTKHSISCPINCPACASLKGEAIVTKEVEKAERDLNNLEEQKETLISRAKLLSKERDRIAFAALTAGDKKAKDRLREINLEDISLDGNIASVEAALSVARQNLADAQHGEAIAADKAKAEGIAELNTKLKDELDNAGDAFGDAIGSVLSALALLREMRALGLANPTDQLVRINMVTAIKTVIQGLPEPWIRDFEFMRLSPSQKKEFKPLAAGWCTQITNQTAARLGENKKEEAA
jgi:hypothetical protein